MSFSSWRFYLTLQLTIKEFQNSKGKINILSLYCLQLFFFFNLINSLLRKKESQQQLLWLLKLSKLRSEGKFRIVASASCKTCTESHPKCIWRTNTILVCGRFQPRANNTKNSKQKGSERFQRESSSKRKMYIPHWQALRHELGSVNVNVTLPKAVGDSVSSECSNLPSDFWLMAWNGLFVFRRTCT